MRNTCIINTPTHNVWKMSIAFFGQVPSAQDYDLASVILHLSLDTCTPSVPPPRNKNIKEEQKQVASASLEAINLLLLIGIMMKYGGTITK